VLFLAHFRHSQTSSVRRCRTKTNLEFVTEIDAILSLGKSSPLWVENIGLSCGV